MQENNEHTEEVNKDINANQKSGKGPITALVIVIILAIVAVGGTWYYMNNQAKNDKKAQDAQIQQLQKQVEELKKAEQKAEAKSKALLKGTFGDEGEYGSFQAEGYPTIVKVNEPFCETNCKQYDYVLFNILRTGNSSAMEYIKKLSGNSAVGTNSIGIGCISNGQISYTNDSDKNGMKDFTLSKEETLKIMNATMNQPVVIDFDKLKYTGGRGAPACYSLLTTIKVVK